jgi:hypothetical protein
MPPVYKDTKFGKTTLRTMFCVKCRAETAIDHLDDDGVCDRKHQ